MPDELLYREGGSGEKMTEAESLALISQMIQSARDEHHENGRGWRTWGWILFIASAGTFLMLEYEVKGSYFLWNLALPVGIFFMVLAGLRRKKIRKNLTYAQELLDRIGLGFFASLLAMVVGVNVFFIFSTSEGGIDFWGFFYILYGFWMYIHGSALKFRPLVYGAILNWIAGIAMFGVPEMKYKMLIGAVAVLLGYLVPGYLLYFQSKRQKK
ncbi:hypothetical protein [Flavihumibacter solisilvae]|uniref:Uncharacterized protein n=1 Tax=Flavihumibacter solisilvae TaxID=1349421 RepID=A0A0C1IK44_9BACT|nr:hypothetical protein [Flavihumibacter solisilvae]KIC94540.1 hypothetical protein OI18_10485 [Flavihumibacter solisilvae]